MAKEELEEKEDCCEGRPDCKCVDGKRVFILPSNG